MPKQPITKQPIKETEEPPPKSDSEIKEITAESMSKAKAAIAVNLQPIQRKTVSIRIHGDSLIAHAWGPKAIKEMLTNQQRSKEEKKIAKQNREKKDPVADYEGARYLHNGKDVFPSTAFKKAMVDAGFMLGIPRPVIRAAIFVVGEFIEIETKEKPIMREDPVRVGPFNKREADLRYRPEYIEWSATLRIQYREDMFTAEKVAALVQNAGFSIGVGEWRPQKEGQHGRFEMVNE